MDRVPDCFRITAVKCSGETELEAAIKKRNAEIADPRNKMTAMVIILTALFVVLIVVLAVISIGGHEKYASLAISQQIRDRTIQPKRGSIYDRNMNVLAESAACWTVTLSPIEVKQSKYDIIASTLSEILEVDYNYIYDKFNENSYYSVVKRKVDEPVIKRIKSFIDREGISGVYFEEDSKRYYPNGSMAAHLLGFTGTDNYGLAGVEAYYNGYLSGTAGRLITAENARSFEMYYDNRIEYSAKEGYSLVLSVDKVAQYYLESALENAVREHNVQNGATGIIMDVNTGEIIAMATKGQGGNYDPNSPFTLIDQRDIDALSIMTNEQEAAKYYSNAQVRQWTNKAVSDLYEPGSVFKVITASMALETHAATLEDTYYCARAHKVTDEVTMYCAITAHGWETFSECLVNSCNPGFIQIGQQVGRARFYSYFKGFGFADTTGIDLPGEARSIYYTDEQMAIVELASVSYGQSNSITPIQMITAFSAVINGGYLVKPHVVNQIIDSEGNTVESFGNPVKRQVISKETSDTVRSILCEIINPQNSAYVAGYRMGGKSGTAEKLSEQAEAPDGQRTFIASFCVFAPADNPQYALLVMLDEARSYTIFGTSLVGPVCAKIMSDVLPYLGIDPVFSEDEMARTDVGVPSLSGSLVSVAFSELQKRGLAYEVIGDGTNVTLTTPQTGFAVPRGSVVYLYTDPEPIERFVMVPDVKGESVESAISILKKAGLNIRCGGASEGWVVANLQSIQAGEEVAAGTVINVDFIVYSSSD